MANRTEPIDFITAVSAPVSWTNVVIVDTDGRKGDFTSIQAAIDDITDATTANRYIILVNPGLYAEVTLTMKSFVHVKGQGEAKAVIVSITNAPAGGIVEADECSLDNLFINASSSGSDWTLDIDQTRLNFTMRDVRFSGRARLGSGRYDSCDLSGDINLNGSSAQRLPVFTNNIFSIGSGQELTSGASAFGHITGGAVLGTGNVSDARITTGVNIVYTGVDFVNDRDGLSIRDWVFTAEGLFTGCTFTVYDQEPFTATTINPLQGTFVGCTFNGISITANAINGPIKLSGCTSLIGALGASAACVTITGGIYPVILSGCTLESDGDVLTASGSGVLIELNGNEYRGTIAASVLNHRLRGTDIKAEFFPVDMVSGTGAPILVGQHPAMDLNAAAETCFVPARISPPADVARIIDALLMLSGEFDEANDNFTDTNGTALAVHVADSGEAWTLVTGTATISSNVVTGSIGGIHTFGAGADTGFLQSLMAHNGTINAIHGMLFRYTDASNYWRIEIRERATLAAIDLRLIRRVATVETVIATTTVGASSFSGIVGVSFFGDNIKVFCDTGLEEPGLAFDITDSFNNTATIMGLFFGGGGLSFDTMRFWRGDTTLDLTVDTEFAQEGAPLDGLSDSLVLANQPIAHRVFSYLDIGNALTLIKQGSTLGARVTLDALGTVNTALRVHGILLRTLRTTIPVIPTQSTVDGSERQQVPFR